MPCPVNMVTLCISLFLQLCTVTCAVWCISMKDWVFEDLTVDLTECFNLTHQEEQRQFFLHVLVFLSHFYISSHQQQQLLVHMCGRAAGCFKISLKCSSGCACIRTASQTNSRLRQVVNGQMWKCSLISSGWNRSVGKHPPWMWT